MTTPSIAAVPVARGRLLKVLGVTFGVAVIVGNTIGAGIMRAPGEIAARLPSTPAFLAVWVFGGLYALLASFSLAELGVGLYYLHKEKDDGLFSQSGVALGAAGGRPPGA